RGWWSRVPPGRRGGRAGTSEPGDAGPVSAHGRPAAGARRERTRPRDVRAQPGERLADRGDGDVGAEVAQVVEALVEVDRVLQDSDRQRDRLAGQTQVVELDHPLAEQRSPGVEDLAAARVRGAGRDDEEDVERTLQLLDD